MGQNLFQVTSGLLQTTIRFFITRLYTNFKRLSLSSNNNVLLQYTLIYLHCPASMYILLSIIIFSPKASWRPFQATQCRFPSDLKYMVESVCIFNPHILLKSLGSPPLGDIFLQASERGRLSHDGIARFGVYLYLKISMCLFVCCPLCTTTFRPSSTKFAMKILWHL